MTGPDVIPDLVPARVLNEHVYCPRLAYLEWVDHKFQHNADTAEGSWIHRRVDAERGALPAAEALGDASPQTTALTVASERLGLIAKLDLIELRGKTVVPVEFKRGSPRSSSEPLWDPELVQVCAHVLLLREAGYRVEHAEVYFHETRSRHRVDIDEPLVERTLIAIGELRENAARDTRRSRAAGCRNAADASCSSRTGRRRRRAG